jgi:hypothetical protein
LENLEGDAYLTDFSHSTDLAPLAHTCSPEDGNDDKLDDAEVDVQSTGVILLQLLTGQSAENHRYVFRISEPGSEFQHSSFSFLLLYFFLTFHIFIRISFFVLCSFVILQ